MNTLTYRITRLVIMATALVQLALSQIHIEMITRLFVTDIGFYLFIFIIAGLLILFNLTSMAKRGSGRLGMYSVMTLVSLVSGAIFVFKAYGNFLTEESVVMETIQLSLFFIIVSMVVYLVGGAIVIIKNLGSDQDEKYI